MILKVDDYYRTLELPLDASSDDIRYRYRQLARVYHPDRYSDPADKEFVEAMMKRINAAYNALNHSPRPQVVQISQPAPTPTVYRTVKGVPTLMVLLVAGIAFVLGAITVQVFNFMPIATALGDNSRTLSNYTVAGTTKTITLRTDPLLLPHAKSANPINPETLASSGVVSATTTPKATATITASVQLKTPVGEQLVMAANNDLGAFVLNSTTNDNSEVVRATIQATATEQPTATTLPTQTATTTPVATNTSSPTATPLPTDTPVSTDTPAPVTVNAIRSKGGVLLTINGNYNVFARTSTSIESEAAELLSIGEQVLVIGRTIDNYWLQIVLSDGRLAWLYSETVAADPAIVATLPVVNP